MWMRTGLGSGGCECTKSCLKGEFSGFLPREGAGTPGSEHLEEGTAFLCQADAPVSSVVSLPRCILPLGALRGPFSRDN